MKTKLPIWVWIITILGLLWNFAGVINIITTLAGLNDNLTTDQAVFMEKRSIINNIVFIIGSVGGTVGTILLLCRLKLAKIVFLISLIGYIAVLIADFLQGAFVLLGQGYLVTLIIVILIAIFFLWLSKHLQKTTAFR